MVLLAVDTFADEDVFETTAHRILNDRRQRIIYSIRSRIEALNQLVNGYRCVSQPSSHTFCICCCSEDTSAIFLKLQVGSISTMN